MGRVVRDGWDCGHPAACQPSEEGVSRKQSCEVAIATTQPHRVVHGQSGLNLLAGHLPFGSRSRSRTSARHDHDCGKEHDRRGKRVRRGMGSPRSLQGTACRFRPCRSLPAFSSRLARWAPSHHALAVAGHQQLQLENSRVAAKGVELPSRRDGHACTSIQCVQRSDRSTTTSLNWSTGTMSV